MKKWMPWVVVVWCLVFGALAQAASFDCEKAKTKIEKLICNNEELSKLDEELAEAYAEALAKSPEPEKLKAEQKEWLKNGRAQKNDNWPQIKDAYQQRIGRFRPIRLEDDKGWKVCKDALARVKSVPLPMDNRILCGIDLISGSKEFSEPPWQELPVSENMDLVYAMETYLVRWASKTMPPLESWRKDYEKKIQFGEIKPRLRIAKVLLSSDGPEENVLAYTSTRDDVEKCQRLVATGGELMHYELEGIGDHIFLFDPASRKVREVNGLGEPSGVDSLGKTQTVIHDSRLYLFLLYPYGPDYLIQFYHIMRNYFDTHNPAEDPLHYHGRSIGDIAIRKPQQNNNK